MSQFFIEKIESIDALMLIYTLELIHYADALYEMILRPLVSGNFLIVN